MPDPPAGETQSVEGLGAGDLVDEVQVDEEQVGLAGGGSNDVVVPHLLAQGSGVAHGVLVVA